jgi:GntR family transcriptional regulator
MGFRVNPSSHVPPSRQLVLQVLDRVASGALAPGDQLPSVRSLAAEALVNPNTAGKAVRDLELLGVVVGRNGLGVFVSDEGPAIARRLDAAENATLSDRTCESQAAAPGRAGPAMPGHAVEAAKVPNHVDPRVRP